MKDLQHLLEPSHLQLFLTNPDELKKNEPIAWEHFSRLLHLYKKIEKVNDKDKAIEIITNWLAKTIDTSDIEVKHMYQEFTQAIESARTFIKSMVREFVPSTMKYLMSSDGASDNPNDPIDLLKMVFSSENDLMINRMRSFSSLVAWSFGMRYLLTDIDNRKIKGRLKKFTTWLEKHLFTDDGSEHFANTDVTYDPKDKKRFLEFGSGPNSIAVALWFRQIEIANNITIETLFTARTKQTLDIFRKVLLKSLGEIPQVDDAQGITFVFKTEKDLELAYAFMMNKIFANPAAIIDLRLNGQDGKETNGKSSKNFAPKRRFIAKTFAGTIEVQLSDFKHFFDGEFSEGEENHHLYRLRQVRQLLKMIFPTELFKLHWDSPETQFIMQELQLNRIRTNFAKMPQN